MMILIDKQKSIINKVFENVQSFYTPYMMDCVRVEATLAKNRGEATG